MTNYGLPLGTLKRDSQRLLEREALVPDPNQYWPLMKRSMIINGYYTVGFQIPDKIQPWEWPVRGKDEPRPAADHATGSLGNNILLIPDRNSPRVNKLTKLFQDRLT